MRQSDFDGTNLGETDHSTSMSPGLLFRFDINPWPMVTTRFASTSSHSEVVVV